MTITISAVRPYTEDSACYYGRNTKWCISATQTRNYFDQYNADRKGFVMVRFNNIVEDDPLRRLAMVLMIVATSKRCSMP